VFAASSMLIAWHHDDLQVLRVQVPGGVPKSRRPQQPCQPSGTWKNVNPIKEVNRRTRGGCESNVVTVATARAIARGFFLLATVVDKNCRSLLDIERHVGEVRERGRGRHRERDTERETQRQRDTERERESERGRDSETRPLRYRNMHVCRLVFVYRMFQ
jgi:hypothetical protein